MKGYVRKGFAFMGLRESKFVKFEFERGLIMSLIDEELKCGLEEVM